MLHAPAAAEKNIRTAAEKIFPKGTENPIKNRQVLNDLDAVFHKSKGIFRRFGKAVILLSVSCLP